MSSVREWFMAMSSEQHDLACQELCHVAVACLDTTACWPGPGQTKPTQAKPYRVQASDIVDRVIVKNFERSATAAPVAFLAEEIDLHVRTLRQRRETGEIRLVCRDGTLVELDEGEPPIDLSDRQSADWQAVFGHLLRLTELADDAKGQVVLADMIDRVPPKETVARSGLSFREVYRLRKRIRTKARDLLQALAGQV
jgi:hypothetical protein